MQIHTIILTVQATENFRPIQRAVRHSFAVFFSPPDRWQAHRTPDACCAAQLGSYVTRELSVCNREVCIIQDVLLTTLQHSPAVYTRLQTVWSLPGHSRQANKGHSPRCHRRPNGPGRLADKVVQPTTQSAEGCT